MGVRRNVAVLGLGRFGQSVARELTRLGHEVLAVDVDERRVAEIADAVTHAVQADLTDGDALAELGLGQFETVVIAMSSSLEASILATAHVRQLGGRRVIAKAASELHGSILRRVGATRVVYPERETGQRLAHSFAAPAVLDYLDVAPGYGIARVRVDVGLDGRRIGELGLDERALTVLALHRGGRVTLNPADGEPLRAGDDLIVAGRDEDLEHLPGAGSEEP
jgi:trk system potassium uptake protein TrkA